MDQIGIDGMFGEIWRQVDKERHEKIEAAVEQMLTDPEQRGVLIIENQFGVIKSAELSSLLPYGTIHLVREDINVNGIVSPPAEGG